MHCGHAFACIETVTERRRLRRLFLRFSFADCRHIASGCRNEGEITPKLASLPLCKLHEKTTFSAWLCKRFPAFVRLFVLRHLFCIGKVFSVCRKRAQTPAQSTNEYLFFLFSAKAVLLAFLYFLFWAKFHFITSIFSGKNNQRQINIRL